MIEKKCMFEATKAFLRQHEPLSIRNLGQIAGLVMAILSHNKRRMIEASFENEGRFYIGEVRVKECTEAEYNAFNKLHGHGEYGEIKDMSKDQN